MRGTRRDVRRTAVRIRRGRLPPGTFLATRRGAAPDRPDRLDGAAGGPALTQAAGLLLLRLPAAVEVGELLPHLRGQVLGLQSAGQADRLTHLGQILGAVRAAGQVRLEAAPGSA